MSRSKSSGRWLSRQARDPYVKRAQEQGFRSRAAFKLAELDSRDGVLAPGMLVVDLGAAPGGWSQYAVERVGIAGRVLAVDVLAMAPIDGVQAINGDLRQKPVLDLVLRALGGRKADLVLSDMAPNLTGISATDQARAMELAELALDFSVQALRPGGGLLIKTFQGEGFPDLQTALRTRFEKLVTRKPRASRAESREVYLLGRGYRGGGHAVVPGDVE